MGGTEYILYFLSDDGSRDSFRNVAMENVQLMNEPELQSV
jgi:hypothetical protein